MTDVKKADASHAGCWVDGHWGRYALAHMIDKASDWGYSDAEVIDIATRHLACVGPSDSPPITDDEWEIMHESADAVEQWMNENIAPEGYAFGWYEGEFYLWSASDWEEV